MRLPVPTNKLVAFTLGGALLTAIVAVGLGAPLGGLTQSDAATTTPASDSGAAQTAADAPTPNQQFTPVVQTQSGYDEHDEAEYEDYDEEEHEEDEEDEDEEHDDGEYDDHDAEE